MILRDAFTHGNPPARLTAPAGLTHCLPMRSWVLAVVLVLPACAVFGTAALAQAPVVKRPYAGPQYPGKPPPLGAPDDLSPNQSPRPALTSPFADGPVVPSQPGADRLPPPGARAVSSGTGFMVAEGRVMTNNHVVAECGSMVARNAQGARVPARVLVTDRRRDLALLAVPPELGPPLTFRDAPPVRRGEGVVTYGYPLSGLLSSGPTLTTGDISALSGLRDNPLNFQISAPVQPGNSGGPLLDQQANVIGVVVSKLNAARIAEMTGGDIPQNVNFAVKGAEAIAFLRENRVPVRTAASAGADKRNFEVGEIANGSTFSLQCFR
jgi:S1-C subfamily serine protease